MCWGGCSHFGGITGNFSCLGKVAEGVYIAALALISFAAVSKIRDPKLAS
jgi:hypothetical protein